MIQNFAAANPSIKLDDFPEELNQNAVVCKAGISVTVHESYSLFEARVIIFLKLAFTSGVYFSLLFSIPLYRIDM